MSKEMRDMLVREFTENYMGKIFYFCLKKTSNSADAEDMTQDIALNVISALNKGTVPESFSAWVWRIARNRYSLWVSEKQKKTASVTGSDVGDYEICDKSASILDEMIHSEDISLLRRELAFIKSDYRDIVIAYYINARSVNDIANNLSLSENAVRQRLCRARITLKEGMNMAREFGKRSYNPEEVSFSSSGNQPSGLPFSVVGRKIPQNILLHASNNPSTAEELSIELGIALPYMEEEIEILRNATLLEKSGDKYVTNFFILDRDCQMDIYNVMRSGSKERSKLIAEFINEEFSNIRALGIARDHIDDNAIRWWLVPHIVDICIDDSLNIHANYKPPVRANGETWGFVGYENITLPEATVMGHNGYGNGESMFWTYKFSDFNLWDQCGEMTDSDQAILLAQCIKNNRNISSLTNIEKDIWKKINGKYAHEDNFGNIVPDILIVTRENMKKLHELLKNHKNYAPIIESFNKAEQKIMSILKRYSHTVLHNSAGYNVHMQMLQARMMTIHDLVDNKFLELPADPSKSRLGMHLVFE